MADNYLRGLDMLIYSNTGSEELPVWTAISGQRGASLSRSADTIEITNKGTNGYKEFTTSWKEWSIDAEGMLIFDNASYVALEDAYLNNTPLTIQLKTTDGATTYSGLAIITDFPLDFPYDDMSTYSITLTGTGALERITNI